jgi:hypothetical protein
MRSYRRFDGKDTEVSKRWAKSTNGPDWIDVEKFLRELSTLHSGEAGLTVLPLGIGANGGLSVAATMFFRVLPGSSIPPAVSVIKHWPCTAHSEFVGHCYALLIDLDWEISKVYKNEDLWK